MVLPKALFLLCFISTSITCVIGLKCYACNNQEKCSPDPGVEKECGSLETVCTWSADPKGVVSVRDCNALETLCGSTVPGGDNEVLKCCQRDLCNKGSPPSGKGWVPGGSSGGGGAGKKSTSSAAKTELTATCVAFCLLFVLIAW